MCFLTAICCKVQAVTRCPDWRGLAIARLLRMTFTAHRDTSTSRAMNIILRACISDITAISVPLLTSGSSLRACRDHTQRLCGLISLIAKAASEVEQTEEARAQACKILASLSEARTQSRRAGCSVSCRSSIYECRRALYKRTVLQVELMDSTLVSK